MLHGMFGGLSNYDPIIDYTRNCNIIVPSIPLYDFSARKLSIQKLSSWLHGFIKELNIENPILLGNSMGGHLALDYAVQYPDIVSALVLTGSSGIQEKDFGSSFPRRKDREYIRKQAALTFYEDLIDDVIMDEIMDVVTSPSKLLNMLAIARDTHEYNMERFLPDIIHPTLLVWGRHDEITPPEVGQTFFEKLPNAQLRWIDKCGHAPMMEHPKRFALLLNEFLIELPEIIQTKNNSYSL
ncbi:alpha/beta fold hydrolase [Fodinibius saliphilus]|uniref:alpha/beta fold hydrolase n=1 Tax=Fodinibius saliphilus TaxID=1920650 RepID=UPI0024824D74|nr:alpha/beta hydrolase [Fodinibius saliphilus]